MKLITKISKLNSFKKLALLLLTLFSLLFLSFGIYKISLKNAKHLPAPARQLLSQANFKTKKSIANVVDAFSVKTYFHSAYTKNLKVFNLLMSSDDINNIKADQKKAYELGFHQKQTASNQQITLTYNQNQIPARISYHGGGADNFLYDKIDYNLKLKDNLTIDEISSFNLFNPQTHHWITPLLANSVAQFLKLPFNRQEPVVLKINNKNQGIYTLEEKVNQAFLDKRGLSSAKLIKLKDETRLQHYTNSIALDAHHLSGFDFSIANLDGLEDPITLYYTDQFYKAIQSQDVAQIINFIDLDAFARYEAYREFLGIDHDAAGDNQIFYFSPKVKKFFPIVRNEGNLLRIQLEGGTTIKSYNSYNSHLAEQYDYPRLFLILHQNSEFRQLKYKYLWQLVFNYSKLKNNFQNIYNQYANDYIYDTTDEASARYKKIVINGFLTAIDNNYNLIKQQLEFNQLAVSLVNQPSIASIEIIPDAVVPIKITHFILEFESLSPIDIANTFNQQLILASYSQDYDLLPTVFKYSVDIPAPVIGVTVKALNQTTNQPIQSVHTVIASQPSN